MFSHSMASKQLMRRWKIDGGKIVCFCIVSQSYLKHHHYQAKKNPEKTAMELLTLMIVTGHMKERTTRMA